LHRSAGLLVGSPVTAEAQPHDRHFFMNSATVDKTFAVRCGSVE
jgi:hypothetical protein